MGMKDIDNAYQQGFNKEIKGGTVATASGCCRLTTMNRLLHRDLEELHELFALWADENLDNEQVTL
ncbi:hypothetical protein Hypma_002710 [Hypsizygus marmoreus]|uniref:Uncharacterized protein n=1 Tax=Hypsizygus marmoreus TaxID=39966 RepID=A0A369JAA8_HYPMA|nr:hypothetical protein Hypma_002710 [Hypsizygus marmoreus]